MKLTQKYWPVLDTTRWDFTESFKNKMGKWHTEIEYDVQHGRRFVRYWHRNRLISLLVTIKMAYFDWKAFSNQPNPWIKSQGER